MYVVATLIEQPLGPINNSARAVGGHCSNAVGLLVDHDETAWSVLRQSDVQTLLRALKGLWLREVSTPLQPFDLQCTQVAWEGIGRQEALGEKELYELLVCWVQVVHIPWPHSLQPIDELGRHIRRRLSERCRQPSSHCGVTGLCSLRIGEPLGKRRQAELARPAIKVHRLTKHRKHVSARRVQRLRVEVRLD